MPPADLAYEKPALAALSKPALPTAFPFDVNPLKVPVPGRPGQVAVYVRIPGGTLRNAGTKFGTFTAGAVVLVRFLSAAGDVVHKESQEFPFTGLLSDAKTMLSKPLVYSGLQQLAPGSYRLQVVVYDEGGDQASAIVQPFEMPAATPPIVGDLMIVEQADKIAADSPPDPDNPFVVGQYLLHPSFDPGVNRGLSPDVNFILPIVLAPGAVAPPMRLSLLSDKGESLASVSLPIKPPTPDGKLFVVGRVPLARIPPNKYTLQVAIGTWPDAIVRKSSLTVVD
jgi:hypothetical protein